MWRSYIGKFQTIPIAWLQLKYQRNQTIAGIVGICCITFLLFIQIGLRNAFLYGALQLPLSFNADIVMTSVASATVLQPVSFSSRFLDQVLAIKEIESIAPLYITSTQWYDPEKNLYRIRVNVIGIPVNIETLNLVGVKENFQKLQQERFALFDRNARTEFAPIIEQFKEQGQSLVAIRTGGSNEVRELKVVGSFELGVNNAYDATFLTSPNTFNELFNRQERSIDIGLIRLKPGSNSEANIENVVNKLNNYLNTNVKLTSKTQLIKQEKIFHENNSPVGFIFRFILIIALVVSVFVLYQILYVKVTHNLSNYATLKAIGFSQSALVKVVLEEALFLGMIGYIPGAIASFLAYNYLEEVTKIAMKMTIESSLIVFSLICLICLISATLSLFKLKDANPIDVFS